MFLLNFQILKILGPPQARMVIAHRIRVWLPTQPASGANRVQTAAQTVRSATSDHLTLPFFHHDHPVRRPKYLRRSCPNREFGRWPTWPARRAMARHTRPRLRCTRQRLRVLCHR